MLDFIVNMLNSIGSGVGQDLVDQLLKTPQEYNPTLYAASLSIANMAVKPLAAVVVAIMATLELSRVAQKAEGDTELSVKIVGMVLFKVALVFWAAQNAALFLKGIDVAGKWVADGMGDALQTTAPTVAQGQLGDQMRDAIDRSGWKGQIACMVVLIIPWLVSQVAKIVFTVVMMLRFVQIYMMTAFNPLPIAFLSLEQTNQWGMNYFKQYASYVFQCLTLYLGVIIYRLLVTDALQPAAYHEGDDVASWMTGNFGNLCMSSILLIGMVIMANGVAKKLFGGE